MTASELQTTSVVLPAEMADEIAGDADRASGFEGADRDSYAIPFLRIIQAQSKQVAKQSGLYIPEARPGMFLDTVTQEVFDGDEGVTIVPCHFDRLFLEWTDATGSGTFVARHSAADGFELLKKCVRDDRGNDVIPDTGNVIVDTREHYVLRAVFDAIDRGRLVGTMPGLMSFARTQIKKSRTWMTLMQNLKLSRADGSRFTPPTYSHAYHVTTVGESNEYGNWYGYGAFRNVGPVWEISSDLYHDAKAFRDAIVGGKVDVDYESGTREPGDDDDIAF